MSNDRYVPALREPKARIVEVEHMQLPSAPISAPMPFSSHIDRATGFSVATMPLAGATGVVVLLIGISAFGVPLLSVAALLLALGGFALTWLIAYIAHVFVSPDGALVIHTVMGWRYLRAEQAERIRRYREAKSE